MKNHSIPNITDSILIRHIQKQTSEAENKKIDSWLLLSSENQHHLADLKKLWQHLDSVDDFDLIDSASDWAKVKARIEPGRDEPKTRNLNSTFLIIARIAAVLIIAAALTLLLKTYIFSRPEMIVQATENNQSEFILSDGSKVYLNEHSGISYPEKFSKKARIVNLKGEGYFEIAHEKKRSFVINTDYDAVVNVLGTSFSIVSDSLAATVSVYVTSGKVTFYNTKNNEDKTTLVKNEKAVLKNGMITKSPIKNMNFLSWKTGILEFNNSRLSIVAAQLSDFYKQTIIITDSSINAYRYTSTINNQAFDEVLEEIKLVFNLEFVIKNDSVFLSRNQ